MHTEQAMVAFLLGVLLIIIYSLERFNTPPSNRASTTAGRYYSAAVAYVLIYLFAYYVLNKYPYLLGLLLKTAAGNGEVSLPQFAQNSSSTVLIAILLPTLIPKVPLLSKMDKRLRRLLQSLAAIPFEALRLSKEIHDAPFSAPQPLQKNVKDNLVNRGFEEQDIVFENGKLAQHLWTKIAVLKLRLESWEQDTRFSAFTHERRCEYNRLSENYHRLTGMALNCFNLIHQTPAGRNAEPMQEAVNRFRSNFMDEADNLFKEICDFMSQAILKCKLTEGARCRELENIGFQRPSDNSTHALPINRFLALYGILQVFLLVNFILFNPISGGPEKVILMVTMIVTIYSVAVVCAVYPKERWEIFRWNPQGHMPMGSYILSGFAAVAIAIPISLLFKMLIFFKDEPDLGLAVTAAWADFTSNTYPWMVMAFVTAFMTAFLIDYTPPKRLGAKWRRWTEAAIQAIATTLGVCLVHWWLDSIETPDTDIVVPKLTGLLRTSAIVGFILGFVVPTWYRRSHSKRQQDRLELKDDEVLHPQEFRAVADPLSS